MLVHPSEPGELDFSIEGMRTSKPGRLIRFGGWRLVRPTSKGPVVVGRTQSYAVALHWFRKSTCGDWIEKVVDDETY